MQKQQGWYDMPSGPTLSATRLKSLGRNNSSMQDDAYDDVLQDRVGDTWDLFGKKPYVDDTTRSARSRLDNANHSGSAAIEQRWVVEKGRLLSICKRLEALQSVCAALRGSLDALQVSVVADDEVELTAKLRSQQMARRGASHRQEGGYGGSEVDLRSMTPPAYLRCEPSVADRNETATVPEQSARQAGLEQRTDTTLTKLENIRAKRLRLSKQFSSRSDLTPSTASAPPLLTGGSGDSSTARPPVLGDAVLGLISVATSALATKYDATDGKRSQRERTLQEICINTTVASRILSIMNEKGSSLKTKPEHLVRASACRSFSVSYATIGSAARDWTMTTLAWESGGTLLVFSSSWMAIWHPTHYSHLLFTGALRGEVVAENGPPTEGSDPNCANSEHRYCAALWSLLSHAASVCLSFSSFEELSAFVSLVRVSQKAIVSAWRATGNISSALNE